ncbi:MAG: gliding motility-associated C-terminal domain-containing protein [Reichenbachiella sp.]
MQLNFHSIRILSLLLVFSTLVTVHGHATHIRAGEIIAERISTSSLTYRFRVIGYTDTGSTVPFGGGVLSFGDGTSIVLSEVIGDDGFEYTVLEDEIAKNVYTVEHTFQTPGRWLVSYNELNRNAGVVNMSNSVDTPFYIETVIIIDPILGVNNTVQFLIPPIDKGAEGAIFLHNPGAFDPDGDSLSYRLTIPKQFLEREVNDYRFPNDAEFYSSFLEGNQEGDGPPTFRIDSVSGTLEWNAPGLKGEYNLAFVVDEWRLFEGSWELIGSVTRDMQVIIEETDNKPPEIVQPEDLCVEAGTSFSEIIVATDPDLDDVKLEAFGGPFQSTTPATYSPNPATFQTSPAQMVVAWDTDCFNVRERPYEIQLKATDKPNFGPKLVDFKTWFVTVVAPAPTGLSTVKLASRQVQLNWDAYTCGNADSIQVWRRVDTYEEVPEECVVGMPVNAGYEKVAVIANKTIKGQSIITYIDDNGGIGLAPGANYCYRLVAQFPKPQGGESYISNESCQQIGVEAPVILNVDVRKTEEVGGEIWIRWEEPFDLDVTLFPRPFSYEVVRHQGLSGFVNSDTLIAGLAAKEYLDTGLNTDDERYNYTINAYDANGAFVDVSFPGSQVSLTATSSVTSITLGWEAIVPWSNRVADDPWHDVYRAVGMDDGFDDALDFILIDSVNVLEAGFTYVDDGSFNDEALNEENIYSYFVETVGSYGSDALSSYSPLLNTSQIVSAQPNDTIPPCAPVAFEFDPAFDCETFLADKECGYDVYTTLFSWEENSDSSCDNDIMSYNIYFSEESGENIPLEDNVVGTSYLHEGKESFKGFYQIAAVDRSGNISERTEVFMIDNCPNIRMPNFFTPNGDNINDYFTPFYSDIVLENPEDGGIPIFVPVIPGFNTADCPRFVIGIDFIVFDRTGGELYTYQWKKPREEEESDQFILWDGTTDNGTELPSGVYYYGIKVDFDVLPGGETTKNYKGWVTLER